VITDREGFLVSGNAPFRMLLGPLAEPPVNLPCVLLSPDGLASRIRNLDEWGWHVIDGIRRKALRHPGSQLAALADELEPLVPPRRTAPQHAGFAVPLRIAAGGGTELTLLTTLAHFATTIDVAISELTLEAFLPGDAATAEYFARDPSGGATAGRSDNAWSSGSASLGAPG
jgi:MmyB-like transcription regulator ligand binding domain